MNFKAFVYFTGTPPNACCTLFMNGFNYKSTSEIVRNVWRRPPGIFIDFHIIFNLPVPIFMYTDLIAGFLFKKKFLIIFLLVFERYFLFWKANALYLSINKSFVLCNSDEHHYVEYKKCIKDMQCINVWILTEWLHIKQTILNRR